jgi:hypothetical protein
MIKLFDYIKILFGSDTQWDSVTNYDKSRNSFLVNRFMGIKYPIQANLFNYLKTDPVGQAESWRIVASKFNRVPGFIYTKVKKHKTEKQWSPDPGLAKLYMKFNEIGQREFSEAMSFNPEQIKISIDILQKQIGNDSN